ncbi:MAG: hypothetical protein VSS75_019490 [Candidatus Parabeggiatoa sp.]|nr:hypothetical protein [Candidatus Parabeggiatoa sp.]
MSDKDDQDWIDLLAGESVANADPKIVREASIFQAALLAHADKVQDEVPYPHILNNVLSRLEKNPPVIPVRKKQSWFQKRRLTKWIDKINFRNTVLTWHVGWAFATVFVLAMSLHFFFQFWAENQIDTSYQTLYANKTDDMVDDLRDLSVRWEGEGGNVFAFGPTARPSQAAKAFGAGLLTGREALIGKSEVALPTLLLPPATDESWLKTPWADDFELGRWTVLLWTASQFHRDLPPTFWDEQRWIFSQLKAAFVARAKTDNEAEKVLSQLKNQIEPHLEKLPVEDNPKVYKNLGFNLKKMMYFLAPKQAL